MYSAACRSLAKLSCLCGTKAEFWEHRERAEHVTMQAQYPPTGSATSGLTSQTWGQDAAWVQHLLACTGVTVISSSKILLVFLCNLCNSLRPFTKIFLNSGLHCPYPTPSFHFGSFDPTGGTD